MGLRLLAQRLPKRAQGCIVLGESELPRAHSARWIVEERCQLSARVEPGFLRRGRSLSDPWTSRGPFTLGRSTGDGFIDSARRAVGGGVDSGWGTGGSSRAGGGLPLHYLAE